jgi:hypothetical protein
MEGKKNKGIIIILIVFILISVCLGGYIVVDKYTNKNNSRNTTNTTLDKKNSNGDKLPSTKSIENITFYEADEATHLISGILSQKSSLSDLNNKELLYYAFEYMIGNKFNGKYVTSFTKSDLEDAFKSSPLGNLNISCDDIYNLGNIKLYNYDSTSQNFSSNSGEGTDGNGGLSFIYINYDFYQKDDKYYLENYGVYNQYNSIGPNDSEYYGKYSDIKSNNILFKNPYELGSEAGNSFDAKEEIRNNFDNYKTKMTKITYIFSKSNDQLRLVDFKAE